ncbi:hypothetical protein EIN_505560 [Entamoeba invadens IP1]|uniref:TLDc domain-containing protein n=1 Tax=Entamoeba invadens IP1 TaxID=370355 RepID=A0A0A1UAX2_ENTIV|nr:hypothetical protein EIN_505560 [Entamoeba invadens IP1]ELP90320.1 hypothetical protein EIN_505560 [Entamoeba invadens IP1]|eukprot:XP_004257091.1 hypothetical protein EIN_505560 [Entamoeba invadens IP1]
MATTESITKKYYTTIAQWTGLKHGGEIYNSLKDGVSTQIINERICGKKNILFLIITNEGYSFGAFISGLIPSPKPHPEYVKDTSKHFVFTLNNPFNTEPTALKRKEKKGMTLCVFPNNDHTNVLEIKKCFSIKNDGKSVVSPFFNQKYDDTTQYSSCLFTGEDTINYKEISAMQWE